MNTTKKEKLSSLLGRLAAEFLIRESGNDSMITVTGVTISDNGKKADILFTAYPENKEQSALGFSNRHIKSFREFVKEKSRIGRIPSLRFKLDMGEKHRQKIDDLIHKNIESSDSSVK